MNATYVLIFAFDEEGRVLLRKKTHPEPQAGKWNGIGGHVHQEDYNVLDGEATEEHGVEVLLAPELHAAQRTFTKETGVQPKFDIFCGRILLELEDYELWIYWLDLGEAARHVWHCLDEDEAGYINSQPCDLCAEEGVECVHAEEPEWNRWFTVDEINDMVNRDWDAELVPATYEILELVKAVRSAP